MNRKAMAFIVIAGLSVALIAALRVGNRADAAAGDCYSNAPGPSTPTICN